MLGMKLVTHQTGPEGRIVRRLLIEETLAHREGTLPGHSGGPRRRQAGFHGFGSGRNGHRASRSRNSGRDFETAHRSRHGPGGISGAKDCIQTRPEAAADQSRCAVSDQSLQGFLETDASLLEINPFITTTDGRLFALDAKITFDDNALFRHSDLRELRDITEEDPLEVEASKYSLNYIKLDGSVGCMVNGAGLAMATMDIIKYAGGMPANFLDVGGGASSEQVAHAFEILLSDKNVKAVLINIFGGILRVDTLATGVVEAARKTNIKLPIVLRLEGTNVDEGKKILMNSGFNFVVTDTMKDAADKVVRRREARSG